MRTQLIFIFSIAIFLLNSCAKVQVSQDFDSTYSFSNSSSYNWNPERQISAEDTLKDNELLARRFTSAIDANLQAQGFTLTDTPEILVSYTYKVTSRLQSDSIQPTIGVGYGRYGRYGGFGMQSGTTVRQYDRGLLTISIHHSVDGRLIWKGTGTREVFTHNSPEDLSKSVTEMVQAVLAQFPPTK